MKLHNIDRLSKEEIFGGKVIVSYRQWLKSHDQETNGYDYRADMAIITHYLQNIDYPEGNLYRNEALPLIENYYRATHIDIDENDVPSLEEMNNLFAEIYETPVFTQHRNNNTFTFVDLFAGIGGFRIALEQLGGRCVYASEFDSSAQKSYGFNHAIMGDA